MSKLAVHFSAKKDDHGTPDDLYAHLNKRYKFKADLAASKKNAKHKKFFTEKTDALKQLWPKGYSFCNPPYGRIIRKFLEKAALMQKQGRYSVFLLPCRTDTKWWPFVVYMASSVQFVEGRITFKGNKDPAPFPSVIVEFGYTERSLPLYTILRRNQWKKEKSEIRIKKAVLQLRRTGSMPAPIRCRKQPKRRVQLSGKSSRQKLKQQ